MYVADEPCTPAPVAEIQAPPIAVVTGASRGLGRALASLLLAKGYIVVSAQRTISGIYKSNGPTQSTRDIFLDLSNQDSIDGFAQQMLDEVPYIDLLVNNAAICPPYPPNTPEEEHWHSVMQVNFHGPVSLSEKLLPLLQRSPRHPRIVNVSSGDGELLFFSDPARGALEKLAAEGSVSTLGRSVLKLADEFLRGVAQREDGDEMIFNGQPAYKLSKAALNVYTRLAAARFEATSPEAVAFVSVCPGDVDTAMADCDAHVVSTDEAAEAMWATLDVSQKGRNGRFLRRGAEITW